MITSIQSPDDAKAFLQEPLRGDREEWLASQFAKNLDATIRGLPSRMRSEIYAVGIGIDPGVSYAGGNLNTESAWSTSKATPPAPELTGRFVPSTWTALDEGFFLLGEDNADNEEQRLIDWCDEFAARYPADLDIDPHLGCWRIVTHGLLSYRESEFGKALSEVPFIASDVFYSDYCGVITELMNVDGQAAPYFAEIAAGVAM